MQDYLIRHPLVLPEEIKERIEAEKSKYRNLKNPQNSEELLECNSEMDKIEEFTNSFLNMNLDVVKSVIQQIQEFLINDVIENSKSNKEKNNNMPAFSDKAINLMLQLKRKNMKEFVIDTKWEYQQREYPQIVLKILPRIAANLLRAGIIRNKFSDKNIKNHIPSEEALGYMKMRAQQGERTEESLMEYVPKRIRNSKLFKSKITSFNKTNNSSIALKRKFAEYELTNGIIEYINEKGQSFANQYMYTFNAIPHRIRAKVNRAFSLHPEEEKKNEYYDSIIQKQLQAIRNRFIEDFELVGKSDSEVILAFNRLDDGDKEKFIQSLVDEDRKNMEYKMALQMTSDYLAGMNDETFKHMAIELGYIEPETIKKAKRGKIKSASVKNDLTRLEEDGR